MNHTCRECHFFIKTEYFAWCNYMGVATAPEARCRKAAASQAVKMKGKRYIRSGLDEEYGVGHVIMCDGGKGMLWPDISSLIRCAHIESCKVPGEACCRYIPTDAEMSAYCLSCDGRIPLPESLDRDKLRARMNQMRKGQQI